MTTVKRENMFSCEASDSGRIAQLKVFDEQHPVDISFLRNLSGLEIAGPSSVFHDDGPVPVYSVVEGLDDYSYPRPSQWGGRVLKEGKGFHYSGGKPPGRQWVGDATDMRTVPTDEYGFVIASHVFEHLANPLKAAREWVRVLKPGGFLLLVVPHRDGAFDSKRPLTPLSHLISDYERSVAEDDKTHHPEVRELGSESNSEEWYAEAHLHRGLHHHVFDTMAVVNVFRLLGLGLRVVAPLLPYHIVVAGCKNLVRSDEDAVSPSLPLILRGSPFPTDHLAADHASEATTSR